MSARGKGGPGRRVRAVSVALLATLLVGLGSVGWHVSFGVGSDVAAVDAGTEPGRPPLGHDEQTCQACSLGGELPSRAADAQLPDPPTDGRPDVALAERHLPPAVLGTLGARAPPGSPHAS